MLTKSDLLQGEIQMNICANSNVIAAIFRRRMGNASKTWLFDELPEAEQKLLVEHARLDADENAVIVYLGGDTNWCMITNKGMAWLDSGGVHRASIFEIERFTHDMGAAMEHGQLDKRQFHELTVHPKSGEATVIKLEPGKPFYGIWRALDWMLEWSNRPEQQAALTGQTGFDEQDAFDEQAILGGQAV